MTTFVEVSKTEQTVVLILESVLVCSWNTTLLMKSFEGRSFTSYVPVCVLTSNRISQRGDANLLFGINFAENCMEMKQIGLREGAHFPRPSPDLRCDQSKEIPKRNYEINKTHGSQNNSGFKGVPGTRAPAPFGPNSFIFMQFSAKNWELAPPPPGKSWISHCRRVTTLDRSNRRPSQQFIYTNT